MASWAAIAKSDGVKNPIASNPVGTDDSRIVVVDANAIISGIRLEGLADKAVTIQEVLNEVRDKQSREFLASIPFGIESREPSDESLAAVTRFARATGDIHTLSTVDLKVLALAYNLEVAAYGSNHLRERPVEVKLKSKHRTRGKPLPGWGSVPNPEDWKAIDEMEDEAANGAGGRIVQQQDISQLQGGDIASNPDADGAAAQAEEAAAVHEHEAEGQSESDDDDDDGWETAAKSANSARKKKRKQMRKEAWEARQVAASLQNASLSGPPQEAASGAQHNQQRNTANGGTGGTTDEPATQLQGGAAGVDGEGEGVSCHDNEDEDESSGDEEGGSGSSEGEDEDEQGEHEGTVSGNKSAGDDDAPSESGTSQSPAFESRICSLTADFAMQNVLLQMGLRLVTRDGRRITRLTRWALRCSACSFVTKEAGRVFCPQCGNMAMERVEVSVGPDGRELFGVRKKHSLRGTRYSLPKPKGGRNSRDPILREDILMQKMPRARKKKGPKPGADALEIGADTLFLAHQTTANAKALAMLPSAKHNPNERKPTRSNRRK